MKKNYILLFFCSMSIGALGQYQYHPFPTQVGRWVYEEYSENQFFLGYTHREYVLDTNDGYMKRPYVWYYEQNKQVFFKYDTGSFKLVYDFNITVGDTFYVPNYNAPTGTPWQTYTTVILDDSNSVDWPGRRMIEFANGGQWVEGMGLVNGFLGIEYSFPQGSLSGVIIFNCLFSDSVSYPCANANEINVEENHKMQTNIFPNPIDLSLNRDVTILSGIPSMQNTTASATIYKLSGQAVIEQEIRFENGKVHLDISTPDLTSGLYVLELKTPSNYFKHKIFIKQR